MFDIVFLDNQHILVPIISDVIGGAAIAVLDCYHDVYREATLWEILSDQATLFLLLPSLANGRKYHRIYMSSVSNALQPAVRSPRVPFYMDRSLRLIVLTFRFYMSEPHMAVPQTLLHVYQEEFNLVVPAHVILSRLPLATKADSDRTTEPSTHPARQVLSWAAWGTETRYMNEPPMNLYNSMYVAIEPDFDAGAVERKVAVVYDFASVPALLSDARIASQNSVPPGNSPFTVPLPTPAPIFVADRGTKAAAPCRRVATDIAVDSGKRVRLFEDGLMVHGDWLSARYVLVTN